MTICDALKRGMIELKKDNIEYPKLKSRLIMQFVLNKTRQYIVVNDMDELEKENEKKFFDNIKKIRDGIPLEYITHKKEFMKLNFYVDENVLIPRQDTEILVEEVMDISENIKEKKILELCTGSGVIAISLARYISGSKIKAIDISEKAIKVAKKNAIENDVYSNIEFIKSNMFENLREEKFDIIVSNPPYIKRSIIKTLNNDVKNEPYIALDGGEDGLDFYRKIISESFKYLKHGGYLCLEIGYDQREDVIILLKEEKFKDIYCKKDLYDNDRVIVARLM